jgi:hypothetical protein
MIYYTLSLSNIPFFNIIPNGAEHIHQKKKQVMLYNTFNIHEIATLPFAYTKIYVFCLKFFKLCSFNDQKHI